MLFLRSYLCPIREVFMFAVISRTDYWTGISYSIKSVMLEDINLRQSTTVALDSDDFIAPLEFFKCL